MTTPKNIIRIWLGPKPIPPVFQYWWQQFRELHPGWGMITITDETAKNYLYRPLTPIYRDCENYSARSDILRYCALQRIGGVYVDTDVMPLRSFAPLVAIGRPFAGKRSGVSFEAAVIGCPKNHPAMNHLMAFIPKWYADNAGRSASVRTGPGLLSAAWFGRDDVEHLPKESFYPFNGFMAPKRHEKVAMFKARKFPVTMYAAHFSNHRWGGKPKK